MRKKAYDALVEQFGNGESFLDHLLLDDLADGLIKSDWEEKEEWATYAQVFIELKQVGALNYYKMFAYYFTGSNDKLITLLWLISRMSYKTEELERLEGKLMSYQ